MTTRKLSESSDEDSCAAEVIAMLNKDEADCEEGKIVWKPNTESKTSEKTEEEAESSDEDSVETNIRNYLLAKSDKHSRENNNRSSDSCFLLEYETDEEECESIFQYDDDLMPQELESVSTVENQPTTDSDLFNSLPKLHGYVCKGQKEKVLKYLTDKDHTKKINNKDCKGRSALHLTAKHGFADIMRILLSVSELRVDEKDENGRTALFEAASQGHMECLILLLNSKANHQLQDNHGHTVLEHVLSHGDEADLNCFQYIFHNFKVFVHSKNRDGRTFLHLAAASNGCKFMVSLLDWGACIDEQDCEGRTPLILAVLHGHENAVKLLLNSGANAMKIDNDNKNAFDYVDKKQGIKEILLKRSSAEVIYKNKKCSICRKISQNEELSNLKKQRDDLIRKTRDLQNENQLLENQIDAKRNSNEVTHKPTFTFKLFRRKSSPRITREHPVGVNSTPLQAPFCREDVSTDEGRRSEYKKLTCQYEELMENNNKKCDEVDKVVEEITELTGSHAKLVETCQDLTLKHHELSQVVVTNSNDWEMDYYEDEYGKFQSKLASITRKYTLMKENLNKELGEYDQEIEKLQSSLDDAKQMSRQQVENIRELNEQDRQQNEEITNVSERRNKLQVKYEKLRQKCIEMTTKT